MQTTIQTRNAPCGHCQIVLTLDDIALTKELRGQLIGAIKAARRKQYCRTGQRIAYRLETKIPSADETDGTERGQFHTMTVKEMPRHSFSCLKPEDLQQILATESGTPSEEFP